MLIINHYNVTINHYNVTINHYNVTINHYNVNINHYNVNYKTLYFIRLYEHNVGTVSISTLRGQRTGMRPISDFMWSVTLIYKSL